MILFLMTIHLIAAVLILILWQRGVIFVSPAMLVICVLLPIWGPVSVLVAQAHVLRGEKGDQEAESSRFGITDEVYRNIRMDKGGVDDVLPIEDVLVSGSPRQRRSLLLSVLHSGPKDFVRPLRKAGVNDDTEVVHYAVTDIRSGSPKWRKNSQNRLRIRTFFWNVRICMKSIWGADFPRTLRSLN